MSLSIYGMVFDCREVVEYIIKHFYDGYKRDGFGFFYRSFDGLKVELREKYFDKYSRNLRPRTGDLISVVRSEIFADFYDSNGNGFDFKISEDLVEKAVRRLCLSIADIELISKKT